MTTHLFKYTNATDLGIVRVTVFGVWFIIILLSPISNYALLPIDLFKPIGIYSLIYSVEIGFVLEVLLSENFLKILKMTTLMGCLLACFGTKYFRYFAIPTVVMLFMIDSVIKSFSGSVNHAELVLLYSAFIISIFPSGDGFKLFSLGKVKNFYDRDSDYSVSILLVASILCFSYLFIGVHRLLHGGIEQFFNNALEIYLIKNSFFYTKYGFDWGLFIVSNEILLNLFKVGFFVITLFEVLSLLILVSNSFRYIWLAMMIPFHLFTLLSMNIFFWENLVLITVLFILIPLRISKQKVAVLK